MRSFVITLALAVTTAACGPEETGWTGVYMIDTWTENTMGCGDPGVSIREMQTDTHFYVENDEFFGWIRGRGDVHVGRGLPAAAADGRPDPVRPDRVRLFDKAAMTTAGPAPRRGERKWTELRRRGGAHHDDPGRGGWHRPAPGATDVVYPQSSDPDDRCPFEPLYEAAETRPCTELEIVHGVFVQDL